MGTSIVLKYSRNGILNAVDKYMFVGFPIASSIEYVFAATNSITKYGIGFMPPLLEKYRMKGVNIRITTSFEVNIVRIDISKYKTKNSFF